jgi:hypothetical protein
VPVSALSSLLVLRKKFLPPPKDAFSFIPPPPLVVSLPSLPRLAFSPSALALFKTNSFNFSIELSLSLCKSDKGSLNRAYKFASVSSSLWSSRFVVFAFAPPPPSPPPAVEEDG